MDAATVVSNSLLILLGVLAVWWLAGRLVAVLVRPRRVPAGPTTQQVLEHPPAVVNLLVNGGRAGPDAGAATLIDLVARGYLEFYQPGPDARGTLVGVRRPADAGLSRYERRVLERVDTAGGHGRATLAELERRHAQDGQHWDDRLRLEVRDDARARGLLQPWMSGVVLAMVIVGAVLSLFVLAPLMVARVLLPLLMPELYEDEDAHFDRPGPVDELVAAGAVITWFLLAVGFLMLLVALLGRNREDRVTAAGRIATAHWLGVANWLRDNAVFASLPPAAVAIWDRLLAYGVAVGAAPAAAEAVGLDVGGREVVRSGYIGPLRTVRVRYPVRGERRYCVPAGFRLASALFWLAGWGLGWLFWRDDVADLPVAARWSIYAIGVAAPAWLLYRVLRSLADLLAPAEVTGQVLTVSQVGTYGDPEVYEQINERVPRFVAWTRRRTGGPRLTPEGGIVGLYFVAVDDGRSDVVRPWVAVPKLADLCVPGSVVRLRGQRWAHRLIAVESADLVEAGLR